MLQIEALKKLKPLVVVGTPGRLAELSRAGKLLSHSCKVLVLDEVSFSSWHAVGGPFDMLMSEFIQSATT